MAWKTTQNRRKVQRALNKCVRAFNESIRDDELWHGRFVVYQTDAWWINRDGSYELVIELTYKDKKTGQSTSEILSANRAMFLNGSAIFERMNEFILFECRVWAREGLEDLKNDTTDYAKIGVR